MLRQSLGFRQTTYVMLLPAVLAIAWFADYAVKRRLRTRLTETGIEIFTASPADLFKPPMDDAA